MGEKIRVADLPEFDAAEHLDSECAIYSIAQTATVEPPDLERVLA